MYPPISLLEYSPQDVVFIKIGDDAFYPLALAQRPLDYSSSARGTTGTVSYSCLGTAVGGVKAWDYTRLVH